MSINSITTSWTRFIHRFQPLESTIPQYHRVIDSPSPEPEPELNSPPDDQEKQFIIPPLHYNDDNDDDGGDAAHPNNSSGGGTAIISLFLGFALAISISAISVYLHTAGFPVTTNSQQQQSPSSSHLFHPDSKQTLSRENWSGAVVYTPPPPGSGRRFAATKGSLLLPRYHRNDDNNTTIGTGEGDGFSISAWVGLDVSSAASTDTGRKDTSSTPIPFLRTGIDIIIPMQHQQQQQQQQQQQHQQPAFVAWYQWYPDGAAAKQIPVVMEAGDLVAIEVVLFNDNGTSGKVVIRNESRRVIVQQFLDVDVLLLPLPLPPSPPVQGGVHRGEGGQMEELRGGQSAEWVVEMIRDRDRNRDSDPSSGNGHRLDGGAVVTAVRLENCVAYTDTEDMVVAEQGELMRGAAGVGVQVVNASVTVAVAS